MSDNLKDILSHLSGDIDQETLLLYLQDKLSAEKKHEVEKVLLENEFANDALEGLQEFKDKQQIAYMVEMLNRDLKKKVEKKKTTKGKNETAGSILAIYFHCHHHPAYYHFVHGRT
ncbi:MAG: hypothetical protein WDO16_18235 [Bacteroidota bacterium]